MFVRVLGIILPVFSIVAVGSLYAIRARPDMVWVNRINIDVLLPAMVTLFAISNLAQFTLGVRIVRRDAALWPILRSPMVIATFLGFAVALARPPMPEWLTLAIKMLGDSAIALVLVSLGVRLAETRFADWRLGIASAR